MEDVAYKHQEILKKVKQYENGVVSDAMTGMGLKYSVNYGLSIPQIDLIANSIKKSNDLAFYLWEQKERESKLLALRLLDNFNLSSLETDKFINGIENIELAEQSVVQLFTELRNAYELASGLIRKEKFIKLTGFLLISRLAMIDKSESDTTFTNLLTELGQHFPKENKGFLKRGFAQALLKTGLRNNELKKDVQKVIQKIKKEDQFNLTDYLEQEVNYFLN